MIVRMRSRSAMPVPVDKEFAVEVSVQQQDPPLGSVRLRFELDPEKIEVVNSMGANMADWQPVMNRAGQERGVLILGGMSIHGIVGMFKPFTLTLRAKTDLADVDIAPKVEECFSYMAKRLTATVQPFLVSTA